MESSSAKLATEVAAAREQTPAERWTSLCSLCRSLAWIRTQPAAHQERVLTWRDPPAASYRALVAKWRGERP